MSKADYAALIALCVALASAVGNVVLRDEAVSNRQLRRAAPGFS